MLQSVLVKFPRRLWTLKTKLISRKLHSQLFHIHPEVRAALANEMPVVALESTIITHGMPYPVNLETALNVENVIRSQGAIPATVAILKGKVHIGLQEDQLRILAEKKENCMKTSRRDLPYVISQNLNGGTTVSGTMLIAHKAGIPIFVTGGIGGVHRGAERTMDVSADLTELGRTPVAVISSGVKSILDIGKTLEYLETQGVCVATLGPSNAFPAFFSATSAFKSPAHVASPQEAACLLHAHFRLHTESGVLLAVPMPPGHEVLAARVEDVIARAVQEAEEQHIQGRDVTPFLLSRVNELTKGQSLKANIVLIENNAKVGGQVAVDLANLRHKNSFLPPSAAFSPQTHTGDSSHNDPIPRPVVLGGSIVDFVATVREDAIRMDASTHRGTIRQSYGGVGRNLADVLTRLGMKPLLLTSVGQDSLGQDLMGHNPQLKTSGFCRVPSKATATYVVILDKKGQFQFGIGDLDVHQDLNVEWVRRYAEEIRSAPLVVMDGNTPQATMDYVLDMCEESQTPVWFEPTDTNKAKKPFHSHRWKTVKFSSPNLAELQVMSDSLHRRDTAHSPPLSWPELQEWVVEVSLPLLEHMQCLMVTLGKQGMLILRHEDSKHSLWPPRKILQKDRRSSLTSTHYPAPSVEDKHVVSVSGAGDCLASGFMAGMLCGMSQDTCAALALETASKSLLASPAVPCTITEDLILKYVIGKTQS